MPERSVPLEEPTISRSPWGEVCGESLGGMRNGVGDVGEGEGQGGLWDKDAYQEKSSKNSCSITEYWCDHDAPIIYVPQ